MSQTSRRGTTVAGFPLLLCVHLGRARVQRGRMMPVESLTTRHVAHGSLYSLAFLLDRLDIQPGPGKGSSAHAKDDSARHVEAAAIGVRAAPAPLTPDGV